MATHSVFLSGKSHGQRSLVHGGYSSWGHKESDTTYHTHLLLIIQLVSIQGMATSFME